MRLWFAGPFWRSPAIPALFVFGLGPLICILMSWLVSLFLSGC